MSLTVTAQRAARRGFIDDGPGEETGHVVPRRAMRAENELPTLAPIPALCPQQPATTGMLPIAITEEFPIVREHPRRRAPIRALLDRLLLGSEGAARRALVDPDQLLAAELMRLSGLDPRWGFLQAVRSTETGSEFDHWVIGPGGVYLLNAKHLPGAKLLVTGDRFLINGEESDYVPRIRGEARRSAGQLAAESRWNYDVNGIIVPVNERRLVIERFPVDVAVVDPGDVANWLVNRPEQMGKKDILEAFSAARDRATWSPKFAL
ncbi:hypothetical protein HMPREF1531_00080 [Propionibacterium sp. oral taxon 192 str. F0372]|uniref:hypothetical protein n=1 Tax=Propionibacterium sp. oral taxon 192 TaxID=671222 RepID=UPI000353BC7B|nr:hypothetical protein [Propionibacterium sp. oral taxon 192]EPH07033.1 hypothetical protein HMPREF1531_00080 [Propionibacterium sp. oral taxon 192 str. F0372]